MRLIAPYDARWLDLQLRAVRPACSVFGAIWGWPLRRSADSLPGTVAGGCGSMLKRVVGARVPISAWIGAHLPLSYENRRSRHSHSRQSFCASKHLRRPSSSLKGKPSDFHSEEAFISETFDGPDN